MGPVWAVGHTLRTVTRRDFWTLKVIHAVIGSAITLSGALAGIFLTDQYRRDIIAVDGDLSDNATRVDSAERALSQFSLMQTEGFVIAALATGEALRPELRKNYQDLGFVIRKDAAARLLEEIHHADPQGLAAERAEQDRLIGAAIAATDLTDWDKLLAFERDHVTKVQELQSQYQEQRQTLQEKRRGLENKLQVATVWGFIIQNFGFFLILLAGLVYQHDHPAPEPKEKT